MDLFHRYKNKVIHILKIFNIYQKWGLGIGDLGIGVWG